MAKILRGQAKPKEVLMKEVVYQECLYKDMTGEDISLQELKKKCGFNCSEETCKYCIEMTIETNDKSS